MHLRPLRGNNSCLVLLKKKRGKTRKNLGEGVRLRMRISSGASTKTRSLPGRQRRQLSMEKNGKEGGDLVESKTRRVS